MRAYNLYLIHGDNDFTILSREEQREGEAENQDFLRDSTWISGHNSMHMAQRAKERCERRGVSGERATQFLSNKMRYLGAELGWAVCDPHTGNPECWGLS